MLHFFYLHLMDNTDRDYRLLQIRPIIAKAQVTNQTLELERFQNLTLRPIAKLQNDLLVEVFRVYINYRKNTYLRLSNEKKINYIEHAVKQDAKLRRQLQGIFIGHFTSEEYKTYTKEYKAFNKRINNLCIERLKSQMQLFESAI